MHIRLAQESDVPAILDISNWAALNTPANFAIEPEPLSDWIESWRSTHAQYPWLVATENGDAGGEDAQERIIGFAKASPHRGRCAYAYTAEVSVYVHPEHHGRGVGTALYQRLIPILREQGYITLIAGITLPNPASERLHESFGFARIGVFQRVGWKFNAWHNVAYGELLLSNASTPPPSICRVAEVIAQS